ncbi:MAG: thioredoxin domain-containing protein [bacterium]
MSEKKQKIIFTIVAVVVIGIIAVGVVVSKKTLKTAVNYDVFAKCLADKNLVMYGAVWCSHCKEQKEAFGTSFQYAKYVECSNEDGTEVEACKTKNVLGFPTWISDKGEHFEGKQSMEKLAEISGCVLPTSN